MRNIFRRLFEKKMIAVFTAVIMLFSISGCAELLSEATGEGGMLNNIADNLGGSGKSDGMVSMLLNAFLGGDSSDFGWGDSSYSGGNDNYTGGGSNFQFADISGIQEGSGKATIMVYIIGSNLETDNACATMDLQEMCAAQIGDNVNLVLEAGGAKKWQNEVMTSGKVGRYRVVKDGIQVLEDRGNISMVENSEVEDFIKWTVKNYPADRYGFIFWDHGGGTMAGFGTDSLHEGSLTLDDISQIFSNCGTKFDFVGFDACLMGTIETAYALRNSADYLIAAEEEEPGYGWSYTSWLKALSKNPSLDMKTLGSIIIDDFVAANGRSEVTLSLIDLKQIGTLYEKICELCANGSKDLYAGKYRDIAKARKNTRSYGGGNFEQIDIIDFCEKCNLAGADAVASAVKDAVVYHKTNMGGTNGLAMYFPFDYPSYYKNMKNMMKSFGMDNTSASGFFNNFLSAKAGGTTSRSVKPMEVKTEFEDDTPQENYSDEEWYNEEIASGVENVEYETTDDGLLPLSVSGDKYVIELSEQDYDVIYMIDLGVYINIGDRYVDMGNLTAYDLDDNGNPVVGFDNFWVAINGNVVPYRIEEEEYFDDDNWFIRGIVEARFTSARTGETRDIDIILQWDGQHDGGYVKGYRNTQPEGPAMVERNVASFIKGDKIQFLCDCYTLDGEYSDCYFWDDPITIEEPLKVSYEAVPKCEVLVYGRITDIYGNRYYSEFVIYTGEE